MPSPVPKSALVAGAAVLAMCLGIDPALAGKQEKAKAPQTSAEANTDNLGSAVVAPLRDINVVRSQIPDLLKNAVADPYAPPKTGCEPLKAEIDSLDAVLGDDYDDRSEAGKGKKGEAVSKPVLGVVARTVTDVIPMRGWVRQLTGAERHDQMVRDAIKAGFVRRGYLKGLYNAGTCKGNRTVFVAAKAAPKPVFVAAEPAAPVLVAAEAAPAAPVTVAAPLAPFTTTIRVAATDGSGVP